MKTQKKLSLKLLRTVSETQDLLKLVGRENWTISFTNNREYYGICIQEDRKIKFSAPWFMILTPEQRTNVIIHEVAHAKVGARQGHNKRWEKACWSLGLLDPHSEFKIPPKLLGKAHTWQGQCSNGCVQYKFRMRKHSTTCSICGESKIHWHRNPNIELPALYR